MQIVLQFTALLLPVSAHESEVLWFFLHKVDGCLLYFHMQGFGFIPEVC